VAQFQYVGRDRTGKQRRGRILSSSRKDAVRDLKEKGIAVSDIIEAKETIFNKEITIGNPVKMKEFVIYLRQFSTLLVAGISVVEATKILASQTQSKALKKALFQIEEELRSGSPFSEAASKHKRIFPPMFIHLIEAGEATGNIDETLDRLALYFERQYHSVQKVKSALIYPIVILLVALGVVTFLLTSVVPTFATMFQGFGAELPKITQFVLGISDWMQKYWWVLLIMPILLAIPYALLNRYPTSRYYLHYAILKIPLFGNLLQKSAIARMTGTLSSLFKSSVPILESILIAEKVSGNEVVAKVLRESRASLQRGQALSEPMRQHWIFPPIVTQMIAIGEKSGSLDLMLAKVAEFYEKEVETTTDTLKSLIEPLMIVFLAAIVGIIVLAIMVPMFEMFNHI
jgi:type IV pilus assembly protein PilC